MRRSLTYANLVSTSCLFVVLGGTSYAALSITGRDVRDSSLTTKDVRDRSLLAKDFKHGQLPTGATGAAGMDGAPGVAGPAGPAGMAGSNGDAGPEGPMGPVGPTGPKGDAGAEGPMGPAGPTGPKGDAGAGGPAGPTGPKGDAGVGGPAGPTGPKGDTGSSGGAGNGTSINHDPNPLLTSTPQVAVGTTITLPTPMRMFLQADVEVVKDGTSNTTAARPICQGEYAPFGTTSYTYFGQPSQDDLSTAGTRRQILVTGSVSLPAGRYSVRVQCTGNNSYIDDATIAVWGAVNSP